MKMSDKEGEILAGFMLLGLALWIAASLTGCVRKIDLWGAKFEFAEGLDFSLGANAVDRVDNHRGVSRLPSEVQEKK